MKYNDNTWWETIKAGKQERLNTLNYTPRLDGMFSNYEVRAWYNANDRQISARIDASAALREQAQQAHELRNTYKNQARMMMSDRDLATKLELEQPAWNFAHYFAKYRERYNTDEDAYRAIIDSATRPNKAVNRAFGLE